MPNPENPAIGLEEDLSDPEQFMIKYEVPKYRPIIEGDMETAGFAGTGAIIGGLATDAALYGDKSLPMAPLNAAGHLANSAAHHAEVFIKALQGVPSGQHQPAEQTVEVASSNTAPAEHVTLPLQAAELGIIVALVTFSFVSIQSAYRYRVTRRRKNFKSSMSYEELEAMWPDEDDTAPA